MKDDKSTQVQVKTHEKVLCDILRQRIKQVLILQLRQ